MSDDVINVGITADPSGLVSGFNTATNTVANGTASMRGGFDALGASAQAFMQQGAAIDAMLQTQAKDLADVAARQIAYNAALQSGVLTQAEYATATATLGTQAKSLFTSFQNTAPAVNAASAAIKEVGVVSAGAQREMAVLAGEAARGNFGQLERSAVTLARQLGLLQAALSPTGAAIIAVGGAIVAGVALFAKGAQELDEFDRALIATGDQAQLTGQQLSQQVGVIGAATGKYGDAKDALLQLAANGKLAGTGLENAAQGAVDFATLTGKSIEQATQEMQKLFDDPVKQSEKLNDQYHYLSDSTYEYIRALKDQGDAEGAGQLAVDAFTDALDKRRQAYISGLGPIAQAWNTVTTAISGAIHASEQFLNGQSQLGGGNTAGLAATGLFGGLLLGINAQTKAMQDQAEAGRQITVVDGAFAAEQQKLSDVLINSGAALGDQTTEFQKQVETYGKGKTGLVEYTIEQKLMAAASKLSGDALITATNGILDQGQKALAAAGKLDALTEAHKRHKNIAAEEAAQARAMDAAFDALQGTLDDLAGKIGGPYEQADAKYLDTLTKLQHEAEKYAIAGGDVATAIALWQQGEELAADQLEKTNEQLDRQVDFIGKMKQTWDDDTRLLGLDNDAHAVMEAVIKAETEARNLYYQGLRDSPNLTDAERNAVEQAASAHEHLVEAVNNSKQVQQDFVNTWKTGFDSLADDIGKFFTGQINSWSDFGKSLVGIAQQIVGDIISQFIKLEFINPILNGLFGAAAGNGSLLPTLASAGGLLGGGGGASSGGVSGGSSGSSLLGDSTPLFSTGQRIWGGIQNGWLSFMNQSPNAGYSMFGSYTGAQGGLVYAPTAGGSELGLVPDYANGGAESIGVAPGSYGYTPSPLGYGLAAAGGLYAGYNEFQNAGGGAAGLAGGAAYGIGTYTLGIAGGAALTGGLGAGLATIGPVGWAALALMAVDMISGGKLFGTKGKFNFGEQAINVGSQGATVTAGYDLKGQKALFGGSTHSWQTVDASPEAQAAADQFFAQLKTGTDQFAKQFGQTVGDVVGGTFVQTFDKKGNITATSDTVLGKTYAGEDEGKFTERLDAENMLAVLDKFSAGISAAVDQYRVDADQLAAVTQSLAAAGLYLKNGGNLMALGADQSLTALLKLAQGSQAFGETIDQTITRLVQAQQQYDQFVGQFKPADTFASPFQAALADIDTQMVSNIAQANALAQAAGAEGAATQDLVNIHNYAAQQFAAAVAKLKVDTNALAAQLGYADSQNLGDLNSQIAALESQQQSAAHATNGLSNAVQSYTQKAIAAMNLLLGDLSPYNDQQKLQMALQGQQAGTVTPDQVLEIARRLDATGADYKAIFDQVMAIGDRTQHGSTGGGGGGASFSSADAAHLAQLQAERDKLAAAQRHADALTEAQNIADLVSSTGESIDQALADAGIKDLTPFLKDLGLKNESDFDDLITKLEKNTDSAGDTTNVLASKIDLTNTLLGQIVTQGGGTPAAGDTGSGAGSGHSGHASGDSDDLAQAIRENTHSNRDLTGVLRQGRDGGQRGTRQPVNVTRTR